MPPTPASPAGNRRGQPAWLTSPGRLVGRDAELAQLARAFDEVAAGACRVVLLSGAAGIGKSALLDELGSLARKHQAFFASGKFQQYAERDGDVLVAALGSLGAQLMAAPADEQALVTGRIMHTLGAQAALVRVVPQMAALLPPLPDAGNPDASQSSTRMVEAIAGVLRACAGASRPVVFALDDIQWSQEQAAALIGTVLAREPAGGLLLVGAFRHDEIPAGHPLGEQRGWDEVQAAPLRIHVRELDVEDVSRLVEQVLALGKGPARRLADYVAPHSHGNPLHTMEVLNTLRQSSVATAAGQLGDEELARKVLRDASMHGLLSARIQRLPPDAREVLNVMACIGTRAGRGLVLAACGMSGTDFDAAVQELEHKGFLAPAAAGQPLCLRHDQVQHVAHGAMPPGYRRELHARIARRIAAHADPEIAAFAADQYASAAGCVVDPGECRSAAQLLHAAAARARLVGHHAGTSRFLEASLELLGRAGAVAADTWLAHEAGYHMALCALGRHEDADAVFARITARGPLGMDAVGAASAQVASLSSRNRYSDAVALGCEVLRGFGLDVPSGFEKGETFREGFDELSAWIESFDFEAECARADAADARVVAIARMLTAIQPAALVASRGIFLCAWMMFQSLKIWKDHGPCAPLAANLSLAGLLTLIFRGDYRTGYLVLRQMIAMCEARQWEPEASFARYFFVFTSLHWFEPVERGRSHVLQALEGFMTAGNPHFAANSAAMPLVSLFESGDLQNFSEQADRNLALARRAGYVQAIFHAQHLRWVADVLTGRLAWNSRDDPPAGEPAQLASQTKDMQLYYHAEKAIVCAALSDDAGMSHHSRRCVELERVLPSTYVVCWGWWLCGLSIAKRQIAGAEAGTAQEEELKLFARCKEWLRLRAIDAPSNFRHLALHLRAEAAWMAGDIPAAARLFDEAVAVAEFNRRPWHNALICERAAALHASQGWNHSGRRLLSDAVALYRKWGAAARLPSTQDRGAGRFAVPARARIDPLDLFRACSALASETSLRRLEEKVKETVTSLTGVADAALFMRGEDGKGWLPDSKGAKPPADLLAYAERMAGPLLVADAAMDERFARDPYFRGAVHCSLAVVPIMYQGHAVAMLLLEDRARADSFDPAMVDSLQLLAGQLGVSIASARLNEQLQRQIGEQSEALRDAEARLVAEARRAGMSQVADNVLHNVGNVVNSVNVSAHVLMSQVRESRGPRLFDVAGLVERAVHDPSLASPQGDAALLPRYVEELSRVLAGENERMLQELDRLCGSIDHIKSVVAMQQSYAGNMRVLETSSIAQLVGDALRMQQESLRRHAVNVTVAGGNVPDAPLDRTRIMQILLNLIENACRSMDGVDASRDLRIATAHDAGWIEVAVTDSGCGIAQDKLDRIFSHGFTTRPGGHGFGLHSSAIAAMEMGGTLEVKSAGVGAGATFVLRLPAGAGAPG